MGDNRIGMIAYILVLLVGSINQTGNSMTAISGFAERTTCESAGEAWRVLAKPEYSPRYYCIPADRMR